MRHVISELETIMLTRLLASLINLIGIPNLIRRFVGRKKVTVLLYHDPEPDVFRHHVEYLCSKYNIVAFADVLRAVDSGDWQALPDYPLVIHIDDGYRRNIELLEICAEYGVAPTLFICSHIVGTNRKFWSKLEGGNSKKLRLVENNSLLEKLGEEANFTPVTEFEDRQALSELEIQRMCQYFDIQSHGRFHFSAVTLSDNELTQELKLSRTRVEELSGRPCVHFSAPYGDYTRREIDAVRAAGYETLRTTKPGWISARTDPYRIPITADVEGDATLAMLTFHLTGIPRLLKRSAYVLATKHIYAIRQRVLMSRRFFHSG